MAAARYSFSLLAAPLRPAVTGTQEKWSYLTSLAEGTKAGLESTPKAPISGAGPSDVRVSPLLRSKWGQTYYFDGDGQRRACYNHYTPQFLNGRAVFVEGSADNYPCGCVATAMSQLMRYHRYPTEPVETKTFTISAGGKTSNRSLLRGGGTDGAYSWDDMVLDPTQGATDAQRQAIAALCHDPGVSVGMEYWPDSSGAYLYDAADALAHTFEYKTAVWGGNTGNMTWSQDLVRMINPNLDANFPVLLGFRVSAYPWIGHVAVCDGYGYDLSTPYHHLDMGWDGMEDCWYNLPDINCPDAVASDGGAGDHFGSSVSISGDSAIAGAPYADSERAGYQNPSVWGCAHIFKHQSTGWIHQTDLWASPGAAGDYFGEVVSICADYAIAVKGYGDVFHYGSAYLFQRDGKTWSQQIKLTSSDGEAQDHFGSAVSISGDYILVGTPGDDDDSGKDSGAAYVFKRIGSTWSP
jgi:Peptidase C10 family/FG-GAP repeat